MRVSPFLLFGLPQAARRLVANSLYFSPYRKSMFVPSLRKMRKT